MEKKKYVLKFKKEVLIENIGEDKQLLYNNLQNPFSISVKQFPFTDTACFLS